MVNSYSEKGEAPIFLLGGRSSLGNAGMINAMSARSNDFEPMFMNLDGTYYPSKESATLINAVLTAAAVYGFSGKDYITNEVIGEDLSIRIMAAGGRWDFSLGYDSSFTMPVYGVCAQLARIRGLNAQQLNDAWGMAMNMSAGTMSNIYDYATSAKLGAGYNIRNADFCTRLAAENFRFLYFCDSEVSGFGIRMEDLEGLPNKRTIGESNRHPGKISANIKADREVKRNAVNQCK